MTDNPVLKIIEKAFEDDDLRCRLMADLSGTLNKMGQKLSPDQMQELVRLLDESGESFAAGLDQRLSQSGVSLSPHALLQQSKKKMSQRKNALEISGIGNARSPIVSRRPGKRESPAEAINAACPTADNNINEDSDEPDYEVERD